MTRRRRNWAQEYERYSLYVGAELTSSHVVTPPETSLGFVHWKRRGEGGSVRFRLSEASKVATRGLRRP